MCVTWRTCCSAPVWPVKCCNWDVLSHDCPPWILTPLTRFNHWQNKILYNPKTILSFYDSWSCFVFVSFIKILHSATCFFVIDFFLFTAYLSCRTRVYPVLCQSSCQSDVEQRALLQFVIFQWHSRELQKTVGNIGKRMLVCWLQGRTGCNRTSCSFWPTAPELVAYWSSV